MASKTDKKETADKSANMADMMSAFQKDFGKFVGSVGGAYVNAVRVPTGAFPFDLATGGGFPRGRASIVYGPQSSSKTNLVLLAIANHQRLWPDLICAFFDIENGFDPVWAAKLGVDVSRLYVLKPDYGEQMVDMVEGFLQAPDCGLVAIDSLAAIISTVEADEGAQKAFYGGNSLLIGKMVRKVTLALRQQSKLGRYPTVVYINQTRTAVGQMFGNPEKMPGGNAPVFQSSMTVRLYGKNIIDSKVSDSLPVVKQVDFILNKWKVPIIAANGMMNMVMVEHNGWMPGQVNDWPTISERLKELGQFKKGEKDKGWDILGEHYPVIDAFKERLYSDVDFGAEVRSALIQRIMMDAKLLPPQEAAEWAP